MKDWFKMLVVASLIWIGMIMFLSNINFDKGYKLGVADGKQDATSFCQDLLKESEEGRRYYLDRAIQNDCETDGFNFSIRALDDLLCCRKETGFLYCEDFGGFDKIPELNSENITVVNIGDEVQILINASYDDVYCTNKDWIDGYANVVSCRLRNY